MTDEMKLLRAFIEASGYEVETILDYDERKISKFEAELRHFKPVAYGEHRNRRLVCTKGDGFQGKYDVDDDGMYTEVLTTPNVDYKVTKKKDNEDV